CPFPAPPAAPKLGGVAPLGEFEVVVEVVLVVAAPDAAPLAPPVAIIPPTFAPTAATPAAAARPLPPPPSAPTFGTISRIRAGSTSAAAHKVMTPDKAMNPSPF